MEAFLKITELKEGTELVLEIVWGESSYEIPTKIVLSMAGRVFIQSFTYKGKTLDLSNPSFNGMVFNMYASPGEDVGRLAWKSVKLEMRTVKTKIFYEVKPNTFHLEGQECERRDAKRIRLGLPGVVRIPMENREINVEIYDLSRDGVAFITEESLRLVGAMIDVFFVESIRGYQFEIHLVARCVRKQEGDRMLYGCHIRSMDKEASTYLSQKTMDIQMEAIEEKRRKQESQENGSQVGSSPFI